MTLFAVDQRVLTALTVIGGLAIFAVLLVATAAGDLRGRRKAKVPVGFRPAPSDEELESNVLVRYLAWGSVALIFIALWIPAYWLREPTRIASKRSFIAAETIKEGRLQYEGNAEASPPIAGLCIQCHGPAGEGGIRTYNIGGIDRQYAEPPLRYIYSRYIEAGRNYDDVTQILYDAINHGRPPGTPMPTWGLQFGGPLNSRQIDTLVAYIQSIQQPFPKADSIDGKAIFGANCAICHGKNAEGGVGPNLTVALDRNTREQIMATIHDGRLNVNRPSMPAWAGLGEPAIEALVQFIESIQRSN